ncbi:type II toxin-antitoxin system VapC family toxin [candidate division KSB1 bacterium]|nr:type II toxin-antitoxin system VapC family toxin [candidate division KSB1 bacterium]NIR73300.1 type II toxin-antitoxin system VapC family toxin [candidate division KSB1 bacterium]NIS27006.1 type II toxin-antitoxin system VapC family toxin [candidate division KSB1 bacterium]NIT73846.1 type II toxin-antitoxin system VapC family toxin [candidate division KSB1 bacterium]NIU27751.1 type II toxin-antitoxin system VapC family toxin [candidate division KSB1 bacterium]
MFLWYITKDKRLAKGFRDSIRNIDNHVFLSVVSLWEVIVKYQPGKLSLPQPPESYLPMQRRRHQVSSLELDEASVAHLASLPNIHRDPFDRILVCQAIEHGLVFITVDEKLIKYPIQVLGQT